MDFNKKNTIYINKIDKSIRVSYVIYWNRVWYVNVQAVKFSQIDADADAAAHRRADFHKIEHSMSSLMILKKL